VLQLLLVASANACRPARDPGEGGGSMSMLALGLLFGAVTLLIMFSGAPIAFALGSVGVIFMYGFMPESALDTVAQNVYEEMASITLLSIPLFILKGAAIGKSRAGQDLYAALHVWMNKLPGGLGIANVFACALFAAMAGSSPATCSAIGSSGIPEMRKRGYSPGFAAGIIAAGGTLGILLPPSITMILYAVAAEQSLGRLFLAGVGPGLLLVGLFASYAVFNYQREYRQAQKEWDANGVPSALLNHDHFTLREKLEMLPRVVPFVVLLIGVMVALYGGIATPSETAGLGAILALALIAVYGVWRLRDITPILAATLKESTMLMFIIGMSLLFSYVMSYLHISQERRPGSSHAPVQVGAAGPGAAAGDRAGLLPAAGQHHPDDAPIAAAAQGRRLRPDLVRRVMTIVMETGLIHPPVGLNIFVIKNIAPDIPLRDIIWGVMPFVGLMLLSVLLICLFPSISTALPDAIMGAMPGAQ
jgi:tripartite ATP-independent transporter DctM subunit